MAASLVGPICDGRIIILKMFMYNITKQPLDGFHVAKLGISTGPWPRYLVMTSTNEGNPSVNSHLLQFTRVLRVFCWG